MYKCKNGWTKDKMIVNILSKYKGQSIDNDNADMCMYRGPEDKQCGVGMFIPDNLYKREMEGFDISVVSTKVKNVTNVLPLTLYGMLDLQSCHDRAYSDEEALENMILWIQDNVE